MAHTSRITEEQHTTAQRAAHKARQAASAEGRGAEDLATSAASSASVSGMIDDVNGLIQKNPIPLVCVGVGLGFLVGLMMKR